MDATIVAGILGLAGTLGAALITAYRDEIKNLVFVRTKEHDYLLATWQCTWDITSDTVVPARQITDQVTINAVNGCLIKGEGATADYGKWPAEGKATPFAVTLSYSGDEAMKDSVGVVILKKESPTRLNGVWCQYFSDGGLKGGTTVWKKIV
jgi:hypothetical protein